MRGPTTHYHHEDGIGCFFLGGDSGGFPVCQSHQTHFAMFLCTKAVPGNAVIASDSCTLESEHPIQRIYRREGCDSSQRHREPDPTYLWRLLFPRIRKILRERLVQPFCPLPIRRKDFRGVVLHMSIRGGFEIGHDAVAAGMSAATSGMRRYIERVRGSRLVISLYTCCALDGEM